MNRASILDQPDARPAATRDDGALRAHVHGGWAAVATAWGDRADYVDARVAGVTGRLLEIADIRPGERVLELACGPAAPGWPQRSTSGPDGEVVVSDVVAEMTVDRRSARGRPAGSRTSAPGCSTSRRSPSPTPPSTWCSAVRDSCSRPTRRVRHARSGGSCVREDGWRSRSGDRASAIRGSAW